MQRGGRGGIGVFAGYVNNLRAARVADQGAVLLLDAGDTFQGGVESNLSEGAVVVDAYNALGYTALAVGNHEFDFGAADRSGARQDPVADPRSALKARAAQANFPFLAANLLDEETGRRVEWPNVQPSTLVDAAGIKVGIVGVMTYTALRATLPLNVRGLRMAPLAETVTAEATRLRAAGAQVVVVSAHAGGGCENFADPKDLSSCDPNAEIFDLARDLPRGLVDAIIAGHTHAGLAHEVAGMPIVQSVLGWACVWSDRPRRGARDGQGHCGDAVRAARHLRHAGPRHPCMCAAGGRDVAASRRVRGATRRRGQDDPECDGPRAGAGSRVAVDTPRSGARHAAGAHRGPRVAAR